MTTVTFFNNKGGVGKTSLVYHLAWMLQEGGRRVIAADLDPQANLTGMFLSETGLEQLWRNGNEGTIDAGVAPLFEGTGDIVESPKIEKVGEKIGLLMGDLALSRREDELSLAMAEVSGRGQAGISRHDGVRAADRTGRKAVWSGSGIVGRRPEPRRESTAPPLVASDYVVIPLAPDLFSLQGLRNVGPTLRQWRRAWQERASRKPEALDIGLPSGNMEPRGYVIMRHSIRLSRPVQAYGRWIDKIPSEYANAVTRGDPPAVPEGEDPNCLAHLKDYRSLMPMAQEANCPMFLLKPADGAIGAHQQAVRDCYTDFQNLAHELLGRLPDSC